MKREHFSSLVRLGSTFCVLVHLFYRFLLARSMYLHRDLRRFCRRDTFVTLTAVERKDRVEAINLRSSTVRQGHDQGIFSRVATLRDEGATSARRRIVRERGLFDLLLVTNRTIRSTTERIFLVLARRIRRLILYLTTVGRRKRSNFCQPFRLFLRYLRLLLLGLATPMVVRSSFTGNSGIEGLRLSRFDRLFLPIFFRLFKVRTGREVNMTQVFPARYRSDIHNLRISNERRRLTCPHFPNADRNFHSVLVGLFYVRVDVHVCCFRR